MKRYRVANMDDLRKALKSFMLREEAIVTMGDEVVAVFFQGGGHNSLGGERTVVNFLNLNDEEVERVSIPIGPDPSYNWWCEAVIVPLREPIMVEVLHERWGDWSPNRYEVERFVLHPDGRREALALIYEEDEE